MICRGEGQWVHETQITGAGGPQHGAGGHCATWGRQGGVLFALQSRGRRQRWGRLPAGGLGGLAGHATGREEAAGPSHPPVRGHRAAKRGDAAWGDARRYDRG